MDQELAALHGGRTHAVNGSSQRALLAEVAAMNAALGHAGAQDSIRWITERYPLQVVLSSSFGADSAVMLHMATRVAPDIPVLLIDTGYLFPETYQFAEELRERLNLNLHVYSATMTAARQEALYGRRWEQGEDGVRAYLEMNKVEPMQRALATLGARAWIAGLRASQTKFRSGLRKIELQDGRIKLHPILDWTKERVEEYLSTHDLPRHPLYTQGYRSIGDWHSTWPVTTDQDDRAGRMLGTKQECGLHLTAEENSSLSSAAL